MIMASGTPDVELWTADNLVIATEERVYIGANGGTNPFLFRTHMDSSAYDY